MIQYRQKVDEISQLLFIIYTYKHLLFVFVTTWKTLRVALKYLSYHFVKTHITLVENLDENMLEFTIPFNNLFTEIHKNERYSEFRVLLSQICRYFW